ncbi:heparinase II/III domain-containing protein [Alkalicoccobacillus murimartini]|uniref:Heparinase II/III-like C-terminal domain-containing protein n=1 Tax=Alkalicoccobacillus murimartini TaxID=171685 RepID=A0ABT9YK97_9BACI|nr:heparinase II/III family protein [Alkalicoccobacillus murimartini]MDQ0207449.1 hypothetical protein [Alkalicoccobacillus murimartini]
MKRPSTDLLFTDSFGFPMTSERAQQKIKNSPHLQHWVSELSIDADRLMNEPIPTLSYTAFADYVNNGNRDTYQKLYFLRRRRLNALAILLYLNPNEPLYQTHLENILWSICEEWTWSLPAHLNLDSIFNLSENESNAYEQIDLFAAETAFSLAEILTMHKNRLPALINQRIHYEIERRVLRPFLAFEHSWEKAEHNWSAVCAGSIGACAIYLVDSEDRLASILEKCIRSVGYFEQGLTDEGVCQEGYHYWQYGYGYYIYFADLLKKHTQSEINLLENPKIKCAAKFQEKVFMGAGTVANFSDALEQASPMLGLSHYLHAHIDHIHLPHSTLCAAYGNDPCYRFAPAIRDLIWFDETNEGQDWPCHESFFPEAKLLLKTATYHDKQIGFAAKGGHNDEPHNHNDLGHFMIFVDGVSMLSDLGAGHYSRAYFGSNRYDILTNGSHGHSVPIIGGDVQSTGEQAAAHVLSYNNQHEETRFSLDLTNAYTTESLHSFKREWKVDNKTGAIKIIDSFSLHSPEPIIERFVSLAKDVQIESGKLILSRLDSELSVYFAQDTWSVDVKRESFIDHSGAPQEVVLIDFTLSEVNGDASFEFDFI